MIEETILMKELNRMDAEGAKKADVLERLACLFESPEETRIKYSQILRAKVEVIRKSQIKDIHN